MSEHDHNHDGPHAVPLRILFAVFIALLILTALTVGVTKVDLGGLNIWIALGVAAAKAILVALYFMHLRWDAPFNGLVLACSFVFVSLFIGFALKDSLEYQKFYDRPYIVDTLEPQSVDDIAVPINTDHNAAETPTH
ncbi:cytochrome C oxidase subunit IV family protein [Poriferisphaera sp. WC338]|uniref:cytochrome C oxidase subunit IV family protein n=1 Tax=Poriferisphaera sp. WC338 TaxID=3425129 RepID=UPI003D81AB9D